MYNCELKDVEEKNTLNKNNLIKKARGRPKLSEEEKKKRYQLRLEKQKLHQRRRFTSEEGRKKIYENCKRYFEAHKEEINMIRNFCKIQRILEKTLHNTTMVFQNFN